MMQQLDLAARAARCKARAECGDPVMLIITEDQREEATQLVGDAPVIVCNGAEAVAFFAGAATSTIDGLPYWPELSRRMSAAARGIARDSDRAIAGRSLTSTPVRNR